MVGVGVSLGMGVRVGEGVLVCVEVGSTETSSALQAVKGIQSTANRQKRNNKFLMCFTCTSTEWITSSQYTLNALDLLKGELFPSPSGYCRMIWWKTTF